ncbi:MAG: glycerophosphodiester phosphodiesterase family protein [Chitinophagaceae bacterium]|nr:glycerophosphodiester phosphodiesterase family protein [Chitinophagaceae bacterium]
MKIQLLKIASLVAAMVMGQESNAQLHTLKVKSSSDLHSFFAYSGNGNKIISGHRGSYLSGYPENSIETFEYVLKHTPAFFEIDPRLTKDSVIVLLHDATLDRTTTGTGKLSDYTWEEVQKFRLKDKDGKVTAYRIPTLQEAIDWARGKTVLNLDKKDVPMPMIAALIKKNKAGHFVMLTVHNATQAKFYFDKDPGCTMSAFVKTEEAMKEYEAAGIPWKNMIAYIGSENKPANKTMFDLLHAKGVMCMISAAPVYDKLATAEERAAAYRDIFKEGADILESDLPVEVAEAIRNK